MLQKQDAQQQKKGVEKTLKDIFGVKIILIFKKDIRGKVARRLKW